MPIQNIKNHIRYYVPHHFIFYPIIIITASITMYYSYKLASLEWGIISLLVLLIGALSFMIRQHYALTNQNRIVRLEMRLRYFILTGKRFEECEKQIKFSQLAALRFASDDELPKLLDLVIHNNMSANEIKKSIVKWLPDDMRV